MTYACPGVRAVYGVDLKLLGFGYSGFDSHWEHGFSFVVFVVCCVGIGLCDGLITCSGKSYRVCVCVRACDVKTSTIRRPRTAGFPFFHRKQNIICIVV